jgi:hypothetical protein
MTTLPDGLIVPKIYRPGLGYSASSGPQVGGLNVGANPREYSSTFFGSDIKSLLPMTYQFSKKAKRARRARYGSKKTKGSHKRPKGPKPNMSKIIKMAVKSRNGCNCVMCKLS